MADSHEESKHSSVATENEAPREPWPEEVEDRSKGAKAKKYFHQHPNARWILALAFIAAVIGGIWVWHYYSIRESTDDAQIDGYIYPVSARVSGTVVSVNVDDNQFVQKGDILVQLDPKDYQIALQRAQAELADAEASARAAGSGIPITTTTSSSQIETARANLNAAQKEVDAANARVREAQAVYNQRASDLKRFEQLVKKEEISQQQYDAALAAEQSAQATLDASRSAVASAESHVAQARAMLSGAMTAPQQIAVTRARAGAADAAVQSRQAAVAQAQLNLGYATIVSPVTGIVSKRNVQPGQVIAPGQPVISVVDLDNIWVTANFKETQLKGMQPNQPANVHVDAFDRDFHGHILNFGGATGARFSLLPPENATGNFVKVVQRVPVKIVLDRGEDPNHLLRPGMSVEATVKTK